MVDHSRLVAVLLVVASQLPRDARLTRRLPVNYGFVLQTVSYDGDPFDALVLGPPLQGECVKGAIVGLMHMEDE